LGQQRETQIHFILMFPHIPFTISNIEPTCLTVIRLVGFE